MLRTQSSQDNPLTLHCLEDPKPSTSRGSIYQSKSWQSEDFLYDDCKLINQPYYYLNKLKDPQSSKSDNNAKRDNKKSLARGDSIETASISSKHSDKHVEHEIKINPRLPLKNNFLEIIKETADESCIQMGDGDLCTEDDIYLIETNTTGIELRKCLSSLFISLFFGLLLVILVCVGIADVNLKQGHLEEYLVHENNDQSDIELENITNTPSIDGASDIEPIDNNTETQTFSKFEFEKYMINNCNSLSIRLVHFSLGVFLICISSLIYHIIISYLDNIPEHEKTLFNKLYDSIYYSGNATSIISSLVLILYALVGYLPLLVGLIANRIILFFGLYSTSLIMCLSVCRTGTFAEITHFLVDESSDKIRKLLSRGCFIGVTLFLIISTIVDVLLGNIVWHDALFSSCHSGQPGGFRDLSVLHLAALCLTSGWATIIVASQIYIQQQMNIKNIRIVTLKYTFPAIVMGIKVVMLIVIIFIDSSINLSPIYIITSCAGPILINIGFLFKEHMYTFPIVKDMNSSFNKWFRQNLGLSERVYPVHE